MKSPYYHGERRYIRKNGQAIQTQLTISLMHDEAGRPINNIGMVEDITERKRAEEALQKAHDELEQKVEERTADLARVNDELAIFHKFAEASGLGFGMGDLEARIAYVNPALCRLFGEDKPEDMIGKSFLSYYPKEWAERRKKEMIPTLERTGHWAGEQMILSRQGQLIPTLHDVFQLRDDKGKPLRRCIVITDITEQKRAEEALERERRTLEHLLRASDHERQLIAYDIHDGLAQQLAGGDHAVSGP